MATKDERWGTFNGLSFSSEAFFHAWIISMSAYGVGDIVTTIALVWFSPHHVEANPIIAAAIGLFGGGGFLALKLLVIYALIGVSFFFGAREDDPLLFYGPPAVLFVIGFLTTALNVALLF